MFGFHCLGGPGFCSRSVTEFTNMQKLMFIKIEFIQMLTSFVLVPSDAVKDKFGQGADVVYKMNQILRNMPGREKNVKL